MSRSSSPCDGSGIALSATLGGGGEIADRGLWFFRMREVVNNIRMAHVKPTCRWIVAITFFGYCQRYDLCRLRGHCVNDGIGVFRREEHACNASDRLTCEQSALFSAIVGALPGSFFSQEQAALVEQLCRHIVSARRLAILIDKLEQKNSDDEVDLDMYWKALSERRKETASIAALMRALRLTNQSRYRPEKAATEPRSPKPWEAVGPHENNSDAQ